MKLETKCPKCGGNLVKNTAELDLDNDVTCSTCGHTAKLDKFITRASRDRLQKAVNEAAIKALSNIRGFKK